MCEDEFECFFVDVIEEMIKEAWPAILSSNHLGTCLYHEDLRLIDLGTTIDTMDSNLNFAPHLEYSSWVSTYEPIPPLASSPVPPSMCPHLNLS